MTVTIKADGRVLIPSRLRRAMGTEPGEALAARVEDGRLILERRPDVIRRLQERFADVEPGVSLTDELIADRHAEVERER